MVTERALHVTLNPYGRNRCIYIVFDYRFLFASSRKKNDSLSGVVSEKSQNEVVFLIYALLGHFGTLGRSLTCFKAWVRLIDDVKSSLTLNDLAVCVATFGGSE